MLNRNDLLERLENIDDVLDSKFEIVAVGGTALVLRGLKGETRDVDFIVERGEPFEFKYAYTSMYDHKIDVATNGWCFQVTMPSDYMDHVEHEKTFENITMYKLSLVDNIITKASRFIDRDRNDILACINYVTKNDIMQRLRNFSLTDEQMGNVKTMLVDIFKATSLETESI